MAAIGLCVMGALGCGKQAEPGPRVEPSPATDGSGSRAVDAAAQGCTRETFADSVDIAEASGAVNVDGVGLLLVSDSGSGGAFAIVDPETGVETGRGSLPLSDKTSDDLEGLAVASGHVFALTSSGWIYELEPAPSANGIAFKAVRDPYAIAEQPECGPRRVNCGYNFEGLCLGAIAHKDLAGCAGAVTSKGRGTLICLERRSSGRLMLDPSRQIEIGRGETLSGCTISDDETVWVATNLLGANTIIEVGAASIHRHNSWAAGSIEAIASTGRDLVLFSDMQNRPSSAFRYHCVASSKGR